MFRENSLVPGSERLERFLLWPTGVLSPGAMRQWGRHAVAFVGKRHFDDPRLMERIFRRSGAQGMSLERSMHPECPSPKPRGSNQMGRIEMSP
jgi:hypothetical protein